MRVCGAVLSGRVAATIAAADDIMLFNIDDVYNMLMSKNDAADDECDINIIMLIYGGSYRHN